MQTARSVARVIAEWGEQNAIHMDCTLSPDLRTPREGSSERLLGILAQGCLNDLRASFATCMRGDQRLAQGCNFASASEREEYTYQKRTIDLLGRVWAANSQKLEAAVVNDERSSPTGQPIGVVLLSTFEGLAQRAFLNAYLRAAILFKQPGVVLGQELLNHCAGEFVKSLSKKGYFDLIPGWLKRFREDGVSNIDAIARLVGTSRKKVAGPVKDVPFENRRFSLVRVRETEPGPSEVLIANADSEQVYKYIASHCGPSQHLQSPPEILPKVGLYVPHRKAWRGGIGEVRISNNPSIGVRRTT